MGKQFITAREARTRLKAMILQDINSERTEPRHTKGTLRFTFLYFYVVEDKLIKFTVES